MRARSDRIEVLEREANRIHRRVAGGAGRIRAMLLQPRAHGSGFTSSRVFLERRHIGRRLRRRRAEQIVEHPLAAHDRRRPGRERRHGQDAGVAEQPAAVLVGHRHAAESVPDDVGNPVVPREPAIDEGVVGREQIDDRAVLAHDAHEEQLRLALHRLQQVPVAVREVRSGSGCQSRRLRRCSHCDAKFFASASAAASASIRRTCCSSTAGSLSFPRRQADQRVVGTAAPQEERQPRRQLQIADAVDSSRALTPGGVRSNRKTNSGSDEDAPAEPILTPVLEVALVLARPRETAASDDRGRRRSPAAERPAAPAPRRILRAHGSSSCRAVGRQVKILRRLGVSLTPVTLRGPLMPSVVR